MHDGTQLHISNAVFRNNYKVLSIEWGMFVVIHWERVINAGEMAHINLMSSVADLHMFTGEYQGNFGIFSIWKQSIIRTDHLGQHARMKFIVRVNSI